MDRDEIIRRIRSLDPDVLELIWLFLELLPALPENQTDDKALDPEDPGPVQ